MYQNIDLCTGKLFSKDNMKEITKNICVLPLLFYCCWFYWTSNCNKNKCKTWLFLSERNNYSKNFLKTDQYKTRFFTVLSNKHWNATDLHWALEDGVQISLASILAWSNRILYVNAIADTIKNKVLKTKKSCK